MIRSRSTQRENSNESVRSKDNPLATVQSFFLIKFLASVDEKFYETTFKKSRTKLTTVITHAFFPFSFEVVCNALYPASSVDAVNPISQVEASLFQM
jgi:hypothetical protein